MPEKERTLALGKVLIAAAWVDHEVSLDEVNNLKDLLFRLPEMTSQDWARLQMYIDDPVSDSERDRLVMDLEKQIRNNEDLSWIEDTLEDFVAADGNVTPEERQVVDEIIQELEAGNTSIFGKLGKAVSGTIDRRDQATSAAPNREEYFDDYISNKIYYSLRMRKEQEDINLDLSDTKLRRLALSGGLLARVARVDEKVTENEIDAIAEAIGRHWDLQSMEASFVAEVAVEETSVDMDYFRMTREFFESTNDDERIRFLDALFNVAGSDGNLSYLETEEIRKIAKSLLLTHKQFIDAKMKVTVA